MDRDRIESYHEYTRTRGVNWALYAIVRCLLVPFFLLYFRLSRVGRENVPHEGGLLVAANHRSFLDPFVIGTTLPFRRPMHYVAKVELFENRLQGWFLNRLGAFPIRRGRSDQTSMETARLILERGGAVCMFPEGTRTRTGSLREPRRGVGRLALEAGCQILPVCVHGSERCRSGWRLRPCKVKVRAGTPLRFPRVESPSPRLAGAVTARIWPQVRLMWEWLGGLPPMRTAAVLGAGSWGTAVATLLARGGVEVQLGTRSAEQAEELLREGENGRYLPGVSLPPGVRVKRAGEIELAAVDLVVFAVPARSLPQAVGAAADRIGERSAVLVLSKGLVSPFGQLPSEYVAERVRCRGVACLGGPAHAHEAAHGSAALVLASTDPQLLGQLAPVFEVGEVVCEPTEDVTGVEAAGIAKNAAALAAAAAGPSGMNAAGSAAAAVWRECVDWAVARGADPGTFAGAAGVGDLVATTLAPQSRNRRAGELLAEGTPAEQIPTIIGQLPESLDAVPLLVEAIQRDGGQVAALRHLRLLCEGVEGTADTASASPAERPASEQASAVREPLGAGR